MRWAPSSSAVRFVEGVEAVGVEDEGEGGCCDEFANEGGGFGVGAEAGADGEDGDAFEEFCEGVGVGVGFG